MGANFSVTQFKEAVAQSGGFARPIFFDCQITCPAMVNQKDEEGTSLNLTASDVSLCKVVNIPEETIDVVDIKYFTRAISIPASRQYQPITFTFYNTVNYKLRRYFQTWINLLNDRDYNYKNYDSLSDANKGITATILLKHWNNDGRFKLSWQTSAQLATAAVSSSTNRITSVVGSTIGNSLGFGGPIESNNPDIYAFRFENAFPTSIGSLAFSQEDDTTFQTFDVTFKYLKMIPGRPQTSGRIIVPPAEEDI